MVPKTPAEVLALILRVGLGAWFVVSGAGKLFVGGLDKFTRDVANYKLVAAPLDAVVAYTVPWVEIIGGICLILHLLRKGTLLAMTSLLLTFCIAVGWAWSKNLDISCGCHGGDAKLSYWWKAIELAGYLVAFGYLWWAETRKVRAVV